MLSDLSSEALDDLTVIFFEIKFSFESNETSSQNCFRSEYGLISSVIFSSSFADFLFGITGVTDECVLLCRRGAAVRRRNTRTGFSNKTDERKAH